MSERKFQNETMNNKHGIKLYRAVLIPGLGDWLFELPLDGKKSGLSGDIW